MLACWIWPVHRGRNRSMLLLVLHEAVAGGIDVSGFEVLGSTAGRALMAKRSKKRTSAAASRPRRSAPHRSRLPPGSDREKKTVAVLTRELDEARQQLSEALEQQTATSEVLQVISSSPGELEPVFQAILANATRLCEAGFANLLLSEGDRFRRVSLYNAPPVFAEYWRRTPMVRPHPESALGRTALTKQVVQIN